MLLPIAHNPFFKTSSEQLKHINPSFYSIGSQLSYFKTLNIERYKLITERIFVIDCLLSFVKTSTLYNLSYPKYQDLHTVNSPFIDMKKFCHINLLENKNCVMNDISFGKDHKLNGIITGPNAGGKSTCIKGLLTNVILSQTICMGSFEVLHFTPFKHINTQINIPDCKGVSSLFEAEMYRCKDNLDEIKNLSGKEFSLVTMDELFNSTNVVEGIAGAYAILNKMSTYPNVINIITTHFTYLTKLKKTNKFDLYKMNAIVHKNGIEYPYTLTRGVSSQTIALDILEMNNFDKDIIDDATIIKNKITAK